MEYLINGWHAMSVDVAAHVQPVSLEPSVGHVAFRLGVDTWDHVVT